MLGHLCHHLARPYVELFFLIIIINSVFIYLFIFSLDEEDLLRYGMDVVLQSNVSGISSALCVLRKVERSQHILSPDEPVSQLHKVALQVKGTSDMFLCLVNDMVVTHKVNIEEQTPAPGKIYETYLENASWTMVGTGTWKLKKKKIFFIINQ